MSKEKKKRKGNGADIWKRLRRNRMAMLGLVIIVVLILSAVFAPLIAPYGYDDQDVNRAFLGPSLHHLFGTDNLGRDIFTRVLYGARITVGIGVGATLTSLVIGAAIASVCALFKKADLVIIDEPKNVLPKLGF